MYPLCFSLVVKQKHMMYWSWRETRIIISGKAEREKERRKHTPPPRVHRKEEGGKEAKKGRGKERERSKFHTFSSFN